MGLTQWTLVVVNITAELRMVKKKKKREGKIRQGSQISEEQKEPPSKTVLTAAENIEQEHRWKDEEGENNNLLNHSNLKSKS